jgi:hypothetical protein
MESLIEDAENKNDLYKVPRIYIEETVKNPKFSKDLHVGVIAAPCHGFGDVVFATKFARYLKNYTDNLKIITPAPEMFKKIGVNDIELLPLKGGSEQCRRLRNFNRPKSNKFDLLFVAPLQQDFKIDYYDVKALFKESTPFNTIFLSEYQDNLENNFDLPTGIGKGYYGLLFDDTKPAPKIKSLDNYALAYLAKDVGNPYCLANFIKMIVKKYSKIKNFSLVIPAWAVEQIEMDGDLIDYIYKYYDVIFLHDGSTKYKDEGGRTFHIRPDILPVPREKMLSLMKNSLPDILVTGDQSVTDVIDCCSKDKFVWYQIVPWKVEFSKALSKALPQKYLDSRDKSCGGVTRFSYYKPRGINPKFKENNDFRKLAKHRLDSIFSATTQAKKSGTKINKYLKQLNKSANREKLIKSLESSN